MFVACEVPASLLLTKIQASRVLSYTAMLWGIVATLTGLTQNYGGLIACRLLLGLAECPMFPAAVVYLTFFYSRKELAVRFGYLTTSGAVAGAVGGLLAYAIGYMDGTRSLRSWRWLLIIEGIPSFCLGLFSWFFLANSPETARYLSNSQRQIIERRRALDQPEASTPSAKAAHRSDIRSAFTDWKIWAFCVELFGADIQLYSYSIFLPTIIKAINTQWSTLTVQALTVPCYAWGAIMYFVVARISDILQLRAPFSIFGAIAGIIGNIMLLVGRSVAVSYLGCFVIATGLYVVGGIALVWMPSNLPRFGKRTTAIGMFLMCGSGAGVAAPYLYPTNDGPRYAMGHGVTIAILAVSVTMDAVLWSYMARTNRRRKAGKEDDKMEGMTEYEINEMGERSPRYIFVT
ncbi:MAG: hypothetical protein Q9167_004382 [Letrouitia subvulpina]